MKKLKTRKAVPDETPNEFIKYGGEGMEKGLFELFKFCWDRELVPQPWRHGTIISLFKKGDRSDCSNYRGITLLPVVGKCLGMIIDKRLIQHHEGKGLFHEAQSAFRPKRSCIDNIFCLNQILSSRKKGKRGTFCFFLDIKKAYDTVWRNGLFHKLWQQGIKGKLYRLIVNMYSRDNSCTYVEGEKSEPFSLNQGVAQGDPLSPTLFNIFINDLLVEIHAEVSDISIGNQNIPALQYADDLVALAGSAEQIQHVINIIFTYSKKWRFLANVLKSAVMCVGIDVAQKQALKFKWGDEEIHITSSYTYLGVVFTESCVWEEQVDVICAKGNKALFSIAPLLKDRSLDMLTKICLLRSVVQPSMLYGSEVWHLNSKQWRKVEAIWHSAMRMTLKCPGNTPVPVMMNDLGLLPLQSVAAVNKLCWAKQLAAMNDFRLPKILHNGEGRLCNTSNGQIQVRRTNGRLWSAHINTICSTLGIELHSEEWVDCSRKEFRSKASMLMASKVLSDILSKINSLSSLYYYSSFPHIDSSTHKLKAPLKRYLHGHLGLGSQLLFQCRAYSTSFHLKSELGRRSRNRDLLCPYCQHESEDLRHVLLTQDHFHEYLCRFFTQNLGKLLLIGNRLQEGS